MDRRSKICARCGRTMTWRRKWSHCWEDVRYCSEACRRRRSLSTTDEALEAAIVGLLDARARDASICPSEAARQVAGAAEDGWRALMEPTREAARRLAARGVIEVTQRGQVVEPSRARGAVRLRRTHTG